MPAFRLMSFNLRRDIEEDGSDRWSERKDAVASLIGRLAPAVLGTQEGLPHQLADLDSRLPELRRVGSCRDGDGAGEHNAVYYDPARVVLVAWGDLALSDSPEVAGSRSWGNRLPRMVTWARFADHDGGAAFTVANTHLDHESGASRARAADFLAHRFPEAVLMGDFNESPTGPAWARLRAGRSDPHVASARGTFHGFSGHAWDRIDGILVPRDWIIMAARIVAERVGHRYPSDHFPVLVDAVPMPRVAPLQRV